MGSVMPAPTLDETVNKRLHFLEGLDWYESTGKDSSFGPPEPMHGIPKANGLGLVLPF